IPAANSSRCSRASSIPTSWSCSNCGRTRPRLTPTPNCRRSARLCRRGCGSAPASARTIPTTVAAERGGAKMQVSYFETGRYYAPSNLPREWPMPAPTTARRACAPFAARRGNGDARHDGRGPADRRHAARHHQRDADLRPQPRGIARAHRRRHGADPACLEGTATVWLAGKAFPLPHRVGVAEAAAAAAAADACPRHQREASDFAARNHIGLGVSFGPFDVMGKVTGYYKEECARYGWQPEPHQIIYRANILIAETGEKAQQVLAQYPRQAVFPLKAGVGAALLELDQRNVAGEGRRPANVNRVLPINFCGGPDEIVAQLKQCRDQIGAGVVDLSFQTPGSEDPDELMEALELFGKKVLPHIRDI